MPEAVHRTPRVRPAGPARTTFDVPALPSLDPPVPLQPVQLLLPVLGSLSILVYGVMARTPVLLVTGGIMALASLASPVVLHWTNRRARRATLARRRERYRVRLAESTEAVKVAQSQLREALSRPHPIPQAYGAWAGSSRLWERRLEDGDALLVRLGTGDIPTGFTVAQPAPAPVDAEPDAELLGEVEEFLAFAARLPAAPLELDLAQTAVVALTGDRSGVPGLARALVLELALACAPDDLTLVVAAPPGDLASWSWAKWVPHTHLAGSADAAERMLATTPEMLERHLEVVLAPRLRLLEGGTWAASRATFPHLMIVVDRFDPFTEIAASPLLARALAGARDIAVSVLVLADEVTCAPTQAEAVVSVLSQGCAVLRRLGAPSSDVSFTPSLLAVTEAEDVARLLAPKRLVGDSLRAAGSGSDRLADLLPRGLLAGVGADGERTDADPPAWRGPSEPELLRIPFGVAADGAPVHLDLKESADGGHGPHGLVIGAVGSGKSELLRTLVAGLAATHRPDEVELAFADFKGGLTFRALQTLPHCSGMVTNLADDLSLVDRMKAALVGELERRQLMLRAAGEDVQRIGQYRALREHRPELSAMPFLVVVVDEFGELLEARPDVLEVLLSIGRTGRSLGVHLVLASQRLEAGRIRGLDSYLGYRICLRTFTAEDSVAVLGTRAAADLPALPGHGYLRTADGVVRFLGATVSGRGDNTAGRRSVRLFTGGELPPTAPPLSTTLGEGESDLAVLVRRARSAGAGLERPPLWLPPLPAPAGPRPLVLGDQRLVVDLPSPAQGLPVPVGLVDHPRVRRQTPLQLDPAALDGHLLVVGAPQSGKSTVLAAFATHAARLHPASLLQFHVLDLGGGALAPLARLPNVASYADGQDTDRIRRVLFELERLVENAPARLRRSGAAGIADWRRLVAAGTVGGPAHRVLLLDQVAPFRDRFPDLDVVLGRLVAEGPAAGVHVAMTSTRCADLPPRRLEQVSTRVELHLNDPMESQHGRVRAAAVPGGVPGRGLGANGALLQIAAPGSVHPGAPAAPDLSAAVEDAVREARRRWPGEAAAPLRRLTDLSVEDWTRADSGAGPAVVLGVDEAAFAPVPLEHSGLGLLVYGDAGSGRSRFLGRLLQDAARLPERDRPQVYVLDYLGALLDRHAAEVEAGTTSDVVHAAAYGPRDGPELLTALTDELLRRLQMTETARRSGRSPRPPHGRASSVANGAAVDPACAPLWLLVDDYELVHAAARAGLVTELANLVPYAARLGLSVLLAQGANGSGARVDPLIRRLLEGSPWHLQFSVESKHELLLRGTRGTPLPPGQALLARPGRPDTLLAVLPPRPPLTAPGTPPPAAREAGLAEPHPTEEAATDVEPDDSPDGRPARIRLVS